MSTCTRAGRSQCGNSLSRTAYRYFVCLDEPQNIYLQTYERGVEDLTLACGTGALASAIAAHFIEKGDDEEYEYTVNVKGGILKVSFRFNEEANTYTNLILAGPAHFVFKGTIDN